MANAKFHQIISTTVNAVTRIMPVDPANLRSALELLGVDAGGAEDPGAVTVAAA
jgi:hypothetical protein